MDKLTKTLTKEQLYGCVVNTSKKSGVKIDVVIDTLELGDYKGIKHYLKNGYLKGTKSKLQSNDKLSRCDNYIRYLPDDMILNIMLEQDYKNILQFCKVHKRFNELICRNMKFWRDKYSRDYGNKPSKFALVELARRNGKWKGGTSTGTPLKYIPKPLTWRD